ncbi:MAG: hypothetical protein PS018_20110 [bacterium]|nr:hypothetical protein [bacterium]
MTEDFGRKEEIKHLRWAINERAKIQHTLLALYELFRQRPPKQYPSWWEEILIDHFLGAGFALWRAVFLADKRRDLESTITAQEAFLKQLLSTNSITFNDDRNNRPWTVTFYLADAKLRIGAAYQFLLNDLKPEQQQAMGLDEVIRYVRLRGREPVDIRYEWQAAHCALRILLNSPYTDLKLKIEKPIHELASAT